MNRNNIPSTNQHDRNRRRNDNRPLLLNHAAANALTNRTLNAAFLYRSALLLRSTELQNFPTAMMPQLGNAGGRMNSNSINMRQDATSLSNFMGNNNNNNRTDAESAAAIQSMLLSSANLSTSPNSLPYLRQFEPMNQSSLSESSLQLQQEQQEQADLLTRYQQQRLLLNQQQQQQFRNQQQQQQQMQMQMQLEPTGRLNNPSARGHGAGAQRGHASNNFQDMMLLQQQQQMRGDDALFNSNAFASLTGYGSGASPTTNLARSQQQQRLQQQSGMFQQQLSTSNHHHQQHQQRLMMNDSLFSDPIEQLYQQQLQIERQLRRRSSLSSGVASISPLLGSLEHQPAQQQHMTAAGIRSTTTNNSQLFGSTGVAGAMTDFSRFSNAGPLLQQQSLFTSLANQPQFNINADHIGNRPPTMLPSSALRNRDDIAVAPHRSTEIESARRGDKKKRSRTFPEKLMAAMIEHDDERAVAWLPDGKSFVIVNPDLFVNEVLQGDFKQAKYASFVRKLHRWGFTRLTSGTGTDCFHHPQFNRNFPDWTSRITCVPMKEAAAREAPAIVGRISAVATAKSRPTKTMAAKEDDVAHETEGIVDKQPSLAGVDRFIRRHSKTLDAETTMNFDTTTSSTLPKENITSKHTDATTGRRLELPVQPIEAPTNDDQPPKV